LEGRGEIKGEEVGKSEKKKNEIKKNISGW